MPGKGISFESFNPPRSRPEGVRLEIGAIVENVSFEGGIKKGKGGVDIPTIVSRDTKRKIIILKEGEVPPEFGTPCKVKIVQDTNPEDAMKGSLIVELVIDPEQEKARMIKIAERAKDDLQKNDLAEALKLMEILEKKYKVTTA